MNKVITTYKKRGETSLEALTRLRSESNIPEGTPMTYAGTLDPMAEGLLLILVGEECKNKQKYTSFDKTYEVEILLGVATDTSDILGLITFTANAPAVDSEKLQEILQELVGKSTKPYHSFSHKKVSGKPLFQHSKDGTISEIEVPAKETEIKKISLLSQNEKSLAELKKEIAQDIGKVTGEFRQEEIVKSWEKFFETAPYKLPIITILVTCSSGTYMRSLVEDISKKINVPALAYKIKRTRIGSRDDLNHFPSL